MVVFWTNNLTLWKLLVNVNILDIFLAFESTNSSLFSHIRNEHMVCERLDFVGGPYLLLPPHTHIHTHRTNAKALKPKAWLVGIM